MRKTTRRRRSCPDRHVAQANDSAPSKACRLLRVPMPSQRMRLAKGWSASGHSRAQTLRKVPIAWHSPGGT